MFLSQNGRIKESELYRFGSNYSTASRIGRRLVELGMADTYLETGKYVTRYYTITPYGKRAADHLQAADFIICGEMREDGEVLEQYEEVHRIERTLRLVPPHL